ncbi:MAG: hypothetical protein F6K16_10665 [Symploca sp. SIO2B6]|nr:hypothetical protein [Symploca sp. SIO2B6]
MSQLWEQHSSPKPKTYMALIVGLALVVVLTIVSCQSPPTAGTDRETLVAAEEAYNQGNVDGAIKLAESIEPESSLYQEAQNNLAVYRGAIKTPTVGNDKETLAAAEEAYNQGNVDEAIKLAESIEPDSSLYQQAQNNLAVYRGAIKTP